MSRCLLDEEKYNIVIFSVFIDMQNEGVGDRHVFH